MDHEDLIFMDDGRETIIGRHSCGPETLGDMPVSKKTVNNSQLCFRKLKLIFLKSATDLSTDQKYLTFAVIKGIVLNAERDPGAL